jgi:hypothetical protein
LFRREEVGREMGGRGWFSHEVSEASTAGSSYPCAALRNCFDDAHPMDGNWKPDQAAQQQTRRDDAGPRSRNETSSVPARISNESMALCRHAVDSGGHRSRDTCPGGRREAARRRLCSALRGVQYKTRTCDFCSAPAYCPTCASRVKSLFPVHSWRCADRARQVRLAWTATRGGRAAVLCAPAPGTASRVPTVCSRSPFVSSVPVRWAAPYARWARRILCGSPGTVDRHGHPVNFFLLAGSRTHGKSGWLVEKLGLEYRDRMDHV